jgi:hypothetical protein
MIAIQRGYLDAASLFLSIDSFILSHWSYTVPQISGVYVREEYECLFQMLNTPNLELFCRNMEFLQNTTGSEYIPVIYSYVSSPGIPLRVM